MAPDLRAAFGPIASACSRSAASDSIVGPRRRAGTARASSVSSAAFAAGPQETWTTARLVPSSTTWHWPISHSASAACSGRCWAIAVDGDACCTAPRVRRPLTSASNLRLDRLAALDVAQHGGLGLVVRRPTFRDRQVTDLDAADRAFLDEHVQARSSVVVVSRPGRCDAPISSERPRSGRRRRAPSRRPTSAFTGPVANACWRPPLPVQALELDAVQVNAVELVPEGVSWTLPPVSPSFTDDAERPGMPRLLAGRAEQALARGAAAALTVRPAARGRSRPIARRRGRARRRRGRRSPASRRPCPRPAVELALPPVRAAGARPRSA